MKHQIDDENSPIISKQMLMILIPLAVIFLLLIFVIIRVAIWNTGSRFQTDPDLDTDQYATESEDYFVAMEQSLVEGREDDGLSILFLGDDIFTYGDTSIPDLVATETGATVYNCAFPKSTLACKNVGFDETYTNDIFSFLRLATCIKANDYTLLDYYKNQADIYDSSFDTAIETLKSIDFNDIDIIFLDYGTYDYLNGYMTTDVTNEYAVNALTGALASGISYIQESYPHIRFVCMSPTFCYYDEGNRTLTAGDIRRVGTVTNENLGGYVVALKAMCVQINISFLDNYFGIPLNVETAQTYLDDAIHINDSARQLIADKVIDFCKNKLYWQ